MTCRAASEELSFFPPGGMSHTTLMNPMRRLGGECSPEQKEGAQAIFSCSEPPSSGGRKASTLQAEFDGKMITTCRGSRRGKAR